MTTVRSPEEMHSCFLSVLFFPQQPAVADTPGIVVVGHVRVRPLLLYISSPKLPVHCKRTPAELLHYASQSLCLIYFNVREKERERERGGGDRGEERLKRDTERSINSPCSLELLLSS